MTTPLKIGILTAGGLAPCLSAAVGALIKDYTARAPEAHIICYRSGYAGLLTGDSIAITREIRDSADTLKLFGGSPIGNSRVKLSNRADCVKRGLVKEHQDPRQVAADQLMRDGVSVLHTIGGDDTNMAAADLAAFLAANGYALTVIGLPKTVDNDVHPIRQSLGAATAAEQGAMFFENVVAEHGANPRMLIVHEVMGRGCGWLTAATAKAYRERLDDKRFVPGIGLSRERHEVHGVYLPEMPIDIIAESGRLRGVMDRLDCVNVFVSEGAGVASIVADMEAKGVEVARDAFGHVKLDTINPGAWFGKQFAQMIGAEKTLVQKSGYFARASAANAFDLALIERSAAIAVDCGIARISGVIGEDEAEGGALRPIAFERIKGGKSFDVATPWFQQMLAEIGQLTPLRQ